MAKFDKNAGQPEQQLSTKEEAGLALEYAISGMWGARERLKFAARGYLENTPGQNPFSGEPRTDVGVKTMVDSIQSEASFFRSQTTMEDARAIVKSADEIAAITRPVFQIMKQLSQYKLANGPIDQLRFDLESKLAQMLDAGKTDAAKTLAAEIKERILSEKKAIESEAAQASQGTAAAENKISEEVSEFGQMLKQGGHNPSTVEHDRRLIRTEEAAKIKGENFRIKTRSATESLTGIEELWQKFAGRYFLNEAAAGGIEAIIGAPPHSDGSPVKDEEWIPIEMPKE